MGDDHEIKVYECPWLDKKVMVPLEEATVVSFSPTVTRAGQLITHAMRTKKFIELSAFFLKVLEYLPKDDDGLVSDEALVYCEWRYIVYLRFLNEYGLTPSERPPPWYGTNSFFLYINLVLVS